MKNKMRKIITMLLCMATLLSLLPITVSAAENEAVTPTFTLPELTAGMQITEDSISADSFAEIVDTKWWTQKEIALTDWDSRTLHIYNSGRNMTYLTEMGYWGGIDGGIQKEYDRYFYCLSGDSKGDASNMYIYGAINRDFKFTTSYGFKEWQEYPAFRFERDEEDCYYAKMWKYDNKTQERIYENYPFYAKPGSKHMVWVTFKMKDGYKLERHAVNVRIGDKTVTAWIALDSSGNYFFTYDYDDTELPEATIENINIKARFEEGLTWRNIKNQIVNNATAWSYKLNSMPYIKVYNYWYKETSGEHTSTHETQEFYSTLKDKTTGEMLGNDDALIEGHKYEMTLILKPTLGYSFENYGSEKSARNYWKKSGRLTLTNESDGSTVDGSYIRRKGTPFWERHDKFYLINQYGKMEVHYFYENMEAKFTFIAAARTRTEIDTAKVFSASSDAGSTKVGKQIPSLEASGDFNVSEQLWYKGNFGGTPLTQYTDKFESGCNYYCFAKLTAIPDYKFSADTKIELLTDSDGDNIGSWTVQTKSVSADGSSMLILLHKYFPGEYKITYDLNGGSWDGAAGVSKYAEGTAITLPTNVTKAGYDFLGWYEHEGAYWYGPYTEVGAYDRENKTFTAKWAASSDTVIPIKLFIDNVVGRLNDKGATIALDKTEAVGGTTVKFRLNVKPGYKLISLKIEKNSGRNPFSIPFTYSNNGEYTFEIPDISAFNSSGKKYVKIMVTTEKEIYDINWVLNGGEKAGSSWGDDIYYRSTYSVTNYGFSMPKAADVTKEGYTFVGWYTNSDFSGEPVYRHEQGETGNKTYYAKWEKANYDIDTGRRGNGYIVTDKSTAQMGDIITVTVIPDEGYRMQEGSLRYYRGSTPTFIDGNTFTMPGSDIQLYAVFEETGEAHVHSFTDEIAEEDYLASPATCAQKAKYYYSCACGEYGTKTFEYGETLEHSFEEAWSSDGANHWHKCANCDAVADKAAHTPGAAATETTPQTCTVCGYVIKAATGHTHSYTQKNTDAKYLKSSATCAKKAVYYYSCSCGEKGTETFEYGEKTSHSFDKIWSKNASTHYHKCSICGEKKDEAAHTPDVNGKCTVCGYKKSGKGDLNGDGKIGAVDLTMLRKYIASYEVEMDLSAADLNGDGKINAVDLTMLRKLIAGYDV